MVNEVRADRLVHRPVDYMFNAEFDDPAKADLMLGPMAGEDEFWDKVRGMRPPKDVENWRLDRRLHMLAQVENQFVGQRKAQAAVDHKAVYAKTLRMMNSHYQDAFNLDRGNPLARRSEAIVAAPHVPPDSVFVATIEIACARPPVDKCFCAQLRPLPITRSRAAATPGRTVLTTITGTVTGPRSPRRDPVDDCRPGTVSDCAVEIQIRATRPKRHVGDRVAAVDLQNG